MVIRDSKQQVMAAVLVAVGIAVANAGCKKSPDDNAQASTATSDTPDTFSAPANQTPTGANGPEVVLDHVRPTQAVPDVLPLPTTALKDVPFDALEASPAVIQRRFYCFHQNPVADDVPKLIATISQHGWLDAPFTAAQISGFVTANVERFPDQMRAWIDAAERDLPSTQRPAIWLGIWNADVPGTEDVLRAYAEEVASDTSRNYIRTLVRQPKWLITEGAFINQLDAHRLMGALVGSGSDAHLARVLEIMHFTTPSQASVQSMDEINAGTNALATLATVAAMNDVLLEKVRALHKTADGEMIDVLDEVITSAEDQRVAAENQSR